MIDFATITDVSAVSALAVVAVWLVRIQAGSLARIETLLREIRDKLGKR